MKINKFKNRKAHKNHLDNFNYNLFIHSFLSEKYLDKNLNDYLDEDSEESKIEDIPEPYRDLAVVFSKKKPINYRLIA